MTLKEQIKNDIKEAMKAGDAQRKTVLGMLSSGIKNRELEKRSKLIKGGVTDAAVADKESELSDEEVIESVSSEIKKRKDSIAAFEGAGRPELAEGEKQELEVLKHYMPEQMSEEQVRAEIKAVIDSMPGVTVKDMGKVIGQVMPKVKGKVDGQLVSQIVKELLS
jgi:uncharacterized protein